MKIFGYVHVFDGGEGVFVGRTLDEALVKLADHCRANWDYDEFDAPEDAQTCVDAYFEGRDDEWANEFDDDIEFDVNDLREAYCAAIDAGHTLDGDHDWINEQMQALNDALPSEWYVHSAAELADLVNPLALPAYMAGIDDFPRLSQ